MNTMTQRTRILSLFSLVVLLLGIPTFRASAAGAVASQAEMPHLSSMLNADGTLDLRPGFSGSLDPEGYTLDTTADGAPRFIPATQAADPADRQWDSVFGRPGVSEFSSPSRVTALAVAADGSVYVGGSFDNAASLPANRIARWDGRSWYALGTGLNDDPEQIAVSGNRVYVVADFLTQAGDATVNDIAQWNGTAWSAVGTGEGPVRVTEFGQDDADINAVAVSGTSVYIGGNFNQIDGVAANGIARWNGTAWVALGAGVGRAEGEYPEYGTVYTIVPAGTKIYVGGDFTTAGGVPANNIAVWSANVWSTLGTGITNQPGTFDLPLVNAIAVNGTSVYAGGRFERAGGTATNNVALWNGTAWQALGTGLRDTEGFGFEVPVEALVLDGTTLYASGRFNSAGGKLISSVASWNGTAWSAVGTGIPQDGGFIQDALALVRTPAGIYVGGNFRLAGDKRVDGIARFSGTEWFALGQGLVDNDWSDDPANINAIAIDAAGRIFVAGQIVRAGGVAVNNIAMWDGARWQPLGAGLGQQGEVVRALAISGNILYAGGSFTKAGTGAAQRVAAWNMTTKQWSALGSGINGDVYALAFSNGTLYAGGSFTAAGSVSALDVAFWDGTKWNAFGSTYRIYEVGDQGSEVGTFVSALAVQGNIVIVGGKFQLIHKQGTPTTPVTPDNYMLVNNVVGWNRGTDSWFRLGQTRSVEEEPGVTTDGFSGFGTDVAALAIIGADVYIGGSFNKAGNVSAANIVRWNATTNEWFALQSGVAGFDDFSRPVRVTSLSAVGNNVFAGGTFTTAGAVDARSVAHWDVLANTWRKPGSGVRWYNPEGKFTTAHSLAATADSVYVGGEFFLAGAKPASGLARWVAPFVTRQLTPAQGGTLAVGALSAAIPAGAVDTNAQARFSILYGPSRMLPTNQVAVSSIRLAAQTTGGQNIAQFNQPATLRIPYSDARLRNLGVTEGSLTVMALNGSNWTPVLPCAGCSIDTTNNVAIVTSNSATEFVLVGTPPPPATALSLNPTSVAFGNQVVGTASVARVVTLNNQGTTPLTIGAIGFAGVNAADFARTTTCPISPATLAAGASCTVSVTFKPAAAGTRRATLTVSNNTAGSPHTVALSGVGTVVSFTPTSLAFGNQVVGTTSAARVVTLNNQGTTPLTIGAIGFAGVNAADFARTTTCPIGPATLAAGASCTVSVTFKPAVAGTRRATLTVSDNSTGSPHYMVLSGIGTP